MNLARGIVVLTGLYAAAGLLFACPFVTRGVDRLDPATRGAGWGFRLLIVPASALLWPLLLQRWLTGRSAPPHERNSHDRAAQPGHGA